MKTTFSPAAADTRFKDQQTYEWAVIKISPGDIKPTIVGRYMNRQDAEDSARTIRRLLRRMSRIKFEVIFLLDEDTP